MPITHEKEWNKQFVNILYKLLKKFHNEHFIKSSNTIENFKSLDEIYKNFDLIESEIHCLPQKPVLYHQPNNIVDVYVNVVLNVLSANLLSNLFEYPEEYNTKATIILFKIYQRYPDTMIRAVVNMMKQNGMMANLKSSDRSKMKSKNKKLALFKISQHYCYNLKSKYLMDTLIVPLEPGHLFKFEEFTSSEIAMLTNLVSMNEASIKINLPDNFISFKDKLNEDEEINEPSTSDQLNTSSTNSDSLSNVKRASRHVLCSVRQKLNNLSANSQRLPDYLKLNGCEVDIEPYKLDNSHEKLNAFIELLNKQEAFVKADDSYLNEIELDHPDKLIVKEVFKTKELGLNFNQLKISMSAKNINDEALKKRIERLCDQQVLFEVGVEEFRYVTHKFVFPWLVHAQMPLEENITLEETIEIEENENINRNMDQSINGNLDEKRASSCSTDESMDVDSNNNENPNQDLDKDYINAKANLVRKNVYEVKANESFKKPINRPEIIYYLPRFWKTPFGKLEKRVILMFLSGILGHVMSKPGITSDDLIAHFKSQNSLAPIQTLEVLNLLVIGGCLDRYERTVECRYTLFGPPDTKKLIYYETSKDSFINMCIIKKKLEEENNCK